MMGFHKKKRLVLGMHYIRKHKIMHQDLKNNRVHITDFGFAKEEVSFQ